MLARLPVLAAVASLAVACLPAPASRPAVTVAPSPSMTVGAGAVLAAARPARPGLDGPLGQTGVDMPALPFTASPPVWRRTDEIVVPARTAAAPDGGPAVRKIRRDRTRLVNAPGAALAAAWPPDPRQSVQSTAAADDGVAPVTAAVPNVDVVTSDETAETPPDTMGDVGPSQVLVVLNGRIRTVSKATGAPDGVLDAELDAFFATAGTGDPRVRYDRRTGRWYVLAFTRAVPNSFLLAVSAGAEITAGTEWAFHAWSNTRTLGGVPGAPGCLGDYPTLGIDEDALYVGVNQFCGANPYALAFDSTSAYVIRKAPLPHTLVVSQFDGLVPGPDAPGPYTPQGVDNWDGPTNTGYFIGVDNVTLGTLVMRRVQSPAGTPSLSADLVIGAAQGVPATAPPIDVPQPGVTQKLAGVDDRLINAVIRNGRLWTVHHVQVDSEGAATAFGIRNGERWYELQDLGTAPGDPVPTVRQAGTVFHAAPVAPYSYWMGALNVNGQGHVALGMSRAGGSTTGFANAAVTGRLAGDPLGVMATPTAFTGNTAARLTAYNGGLITPVKRWGDYSHTSVDPADDMTFWTLQEYVRADDQWAVRLARVVAPPPAAITAVAPRRIIASPGLRTLVVTGAATGGAGFYDPGSAFPRRVAAAFDGSGDVTVTGVTVDSPTQLRLTISSSGAAAGPRTLTVTNPDGQVSTLAGALQINGPPVAAPDAYAGSYGRALTVAAPGVLANDADVNGDPLTAQLVTPPTTGTLSLSAAGGFSYTPAPGFTGQVSFAYRASDGLAVGGTATVTITVGANTAPTIGTVADRTLIDPGSGAAVASGGIGLSVDDGDSGAAGLTLSAASANQAIVADASLTVRGTGTARQLSFATVPGAPEGSTLITVTVSDGHATAATAFTVTLRRSIAPVPSADQYTTGFGRALTVAAPGVLANDVEPDGQSMAATLAVPPSAGTVSLASNGGFTFTPSATASGPVTFAYRASDGVFSSAPATVTVVVGANAVPVVTPPAPQTLEETGTGRIGPLPFLVSDPDGRPVTVTATSSNPAVVAPSGITLAGSGASWTITLAAVPGSPGGVTTITLRASDGLDTGSGSFTVAVVPRRGAPRDLSAVVGRGTVRFAWAPPPATREPVTGYVLEAGVTPGMPLLVLPVGPSPELTLSAPPGVFFVRVRTRTAGGQSLPSEEIRIDTELRGVPHAPAALLATVHGHAVALQWTENPDGPAIGGYQLQAGRSPGASDLGVVPLPATSRTFAATVPPGTYVVRVAATNGRGVGAPSNEVVLTVGAGACTIPATPTGLRAHVAAGTVTLAWDAAARGGIPTGYRLEAGRAPGTRDVGLVPLGGAATAVSGVLPPGDYVARLVAANACGESPATRDVAFVVR